MSDIEGCLACELSNGKRHLPGGAIFSSDLWRVEHCIGPLGVGTLIVKPLRHVTQFSELTPAEIGEFGPLLHATTVAIVAELSADQTYICEWSHLDWKPGHIHFVVQPAWNASGKNYERPGPFLQVAMFREASLPDAEAVGAICVRLRSRLAARDARP